MGQQREQHKDCFQRAVFVSQGKKITRFHKDRVVLYLIACHPLEIVSHTLLATIPWLSKPSWLEKQRTKSTKTSQNDNYSMHLLRQKRCQKNFKNILPTFVCPNLSIHASCRNFVSVGSVCVSLGRIHPDKLLIDCAPGPPTNFWPPPGLTTWLDQKYFKVTILLDQEV